MPATATREARTEDELQAAEEALFREARALRRRRWLIRSALIVALLAVSAGVIAVATGGGRGPTAAHGPRRSAGLPTGQVAGLGVAGSLAVGPTGRLYVADVSHHRILVRLPDGRFRVVAGTGAAGFSGDGRSALQARLSSVSDLTFSRAGDLYFVDGGRVRVIAPDGVIHAVAGDGRPSRRVRGGTPARRAGFGSARSIAAGENLAIALSPAGELYVATQTQLLRLTAAGTLVTVPDRATGSPVVHGDITDLGQIAVDAHRDIDVSGVNGWFIWQVTPDGRAHQIIALARISGGGDSDLERAPDGSVYGENGPHLLRVTPHRLLPDLRFGRGRTEYFYPTWFAFGPHGTIYLDELPGDSGFEAHQQLIAVHHSSVSLLWQQRNRGHRDSFGPR